MNATITQQVLFDYNALDPESRIKLQQIERELKEDHATVDRLVAETLDRMWIIGSKYHEVQLLLRSRTTNNFKQWFTATHEADNGGLLRKAYRCINIYQKVERDKLSLLADTGKSTVYTLATKETPNAARAEIFKRLKAGEALTGNDIVEIIESAKAREMPMMLPMVIEEPVATGIETFQHLTPGDENATHFVDANEIVVPVVADKPKSSVSEVRCCPYCHVEQTIMRIYLNDNLDVVCKNCAKKNLAQNWWTEKITEVIRYCIHCDHIQNIRNWLSDSAPYVKCEGCGKEERAFKWSLSPRPSVPPIAPPPPPPPPAAKPVSELAKVEYDEEADDEEDDGAVELTPIVPPPPPASGLPLPPPPPPPMVLSSQVDIMVEFSKLAGEKQFEVAWLILTKLSKQQVSNLFIKYQTEK